MNRRQRRRRARIKKLLLFAPPVMAGVVWMVGLTLPEMHHETTRVWLPGTPDAVWEVLTDLDGMPNWRRDLVSLERLPGGLGTVRWREVGTGGAVAFERTAAVAPSFMVVRVAGTVGVRRQWTYRIRAANQGTELAVVEEARIENPFRRALVGLFGGDRGRMRRLGRDLVRRLDIRHEFAVQANR